MALCRAATNRFLASTGRTSVSMLSVMVFCYVFQTAYRKADDPKNQRKLCRASSTRSLTRRMLPRRGPWSAGRSLGSVLEGLCLQQGEDGDLGRLQRPTASGGKEERLPPRQSAVATCLGAGS